MPLIHQLSPHLADMIAAGEVVERPASVVKNCWKTPSTPGQRRDRGTARRRYEPDPRQRQRLRHRAEELKDRLPAPRHLKAPDRGGPLLHRHAGLSGRGAGGHRRGVPGGDRFPAAAARPRGRGCCWRAALPGETEDWGCPEGTVLSVRDLFFQHPRPHEIHEKRTAPRLPPPRRWSSTRPCPIPACPSSCSATGPSSSAPPRRPAASARSTPPWAGSSPCPSCPWRAAGGAILVEGFVSRSLQCRGSRSMQHFYVNGRYVKSPLLTAALEEAYRNQMMKGKFPGCVLHISLPLDAVDVNVHPGQNGGEIPERAGGFRRGVLRREARPGDRRRAAGGKGCAADPRDARRRAGAPLRRPRFRGGDAPHGALLPDHDRPGIPRPGRRRQAPDQLHRKTVGALGGGDARHRLRGGRHPSAGPHAGARSGAEHGRAGCSLAPRPAGTGGARRAGGVPRAGKAPGSGDDRPAGAVGGRGCPDAPDAGDGSALAHCRRSAAHLHHLRGRRGQRLPHRQARRPRARQFRPYESRRRAHHGPAAARSEAVTLAAGEYAALLEHLDLLNRFGFEAEDFGDNTILCRTCPAEIDAAAIAPALEEIAAELLRTGRADPDSARDVMLHTMPARPPSRPAWSMTNGNCASSWIKSRAGTSNIVPMGGL